MPNNETCLNPPAVQSGGVRTTIALHCGWMISNMAAEAWLFGEFSYAFFKSMTSYIAFYFTQITSLATC